MASTSSFTLYMLLVVMACIESSAAASPGLGEIVGAFVLPHGGIAFDPKHFNTTNQTAREEAWLLHDSAKTVGFIVSSLQPDLILLSTPHGIADLDKFQFYLNPKGFGSADTDNYKGPYRLSVNLDSVSSQLLVRELGKSGENVSGLSAFGPPGGADDPFPLRWGEVVPLSYVPGLDNMKVIIISQPSRRYNDSVEMIPELLRLGNGRDPKFLHDLTKCFKEWDDKVSRVSALRPRASLHNQLLLLRQRIVVIISADLAHTHDKNGPYGFSTAAEPFDQACGLWASSLDEEALLSTAAKYVDKALSCGYTGLVMLHGLLKEASLDVWTPKLYANFHPSYYGMMVASFLKN